MLGLTLPLRSENNYWEWILSFYHVGPSDQTQVVRLVSKQLYLWHHRDSPLALALFRVLSSSVPDFWSQLLERAHGWPVVGAHIQNYRRIANLRLAQARPGIKIQGLGGGAVQISGRMPAWHGSGLRFASQNCKSIQNLTVGWVDNAVSSRVTVEWPCVWKSCSQALSLLRIYVCVLGYMEPWIKEKRDSDDSGFSAAGDQPLKVGNTYRPIEALFIVTQKAPLPSQFPNPKTHLA